MIQKPISSISKEDIESLINAKLGEKRTLDYKQELPDNSSEGKREFLYDVSSFANSAGGDLIFGVSDERDANGKATGLPASAEGLNLPNASDAISRLENLVRDGIIPRLRGIEWQIVIGFAAGPVLVMRIPKGLIGPHMVVFGGMARFYSRNSTGKYPMDYGEIRASFVESTDISERLRSFRNQRISATMEGNTPLGVERKPTALVHLLPLSSLEFGVPRDVSRSVAKLQNLLEPLRGGGGWSGRFNFDGYLVRSMLPSYVQIFRSGTIEAADTALLDIKYAEYANTIQGIAFEQILINAIQRYLDVQNRLAISLPIFIAITLLRAQGFSMSSYQSVGRTAAIDRDILPLPEITVDDFGTDVGKTLQPSFDALWQSCGHEKSPNYDDKGNWRPHQP